MGSDDGALVDRGRSLGSCRRLYDSVGGVFVSGGDMS
jgi:hypothetical protein